MIESMLNKAFRERSNLVRPCWLFCQHVWTAEGKKLPDDPKRLTKAERPELFDVALFSLGADWHAGLVWPDGLHFVHAHPDGNTRTESYIVTKDRLTSFPWKAVLRGFYR